MRAKELLDEWAGKEGVDRDWLTATYHAYLAEGHRATEPRRRVLAWVAATTAPFSPEAAVDMLEGQLRDSSRATIYRMLDWLRSAGWLGRIYDEGGQHSYVRRRPGHQHTVLCTACGSTLEVGGCAIEDAFSTALAGTGFEIKGHLLQLYGLCSQCRTGQGATG